MSKNKCRKLGNRATKAELKEAHRIRQEMKEAMRSQISGSNEYVLANISPKHEDFGSTPKEHEAYRRDRLI